VKTVPGTVLLLSGSLATDILKPHACFDRTTDGRSR
jgi:hypothetical protein